MITAAASVSDDDDFALLVQTIHHQRKKRGKTVEILKCEKNLAQTELSSWPKHKTTSSSSS